MGPLASSFNNFLGTLGDQNADKLSILTNFVSPTVYELIADENNYDRAIEILNDHFIKPKNEVFARHLLSTCKQESGESLDQFVRRLKTLTQDCNFKSVSAEQYRDDSIRDAFISGIKSQQIRLRLLEKKQLDFQTAFDTARTLEMAEQQSFSYNQPSLTAAALNTFSNPVANAPTTPLDHLEQNDAACAGTYNYKTDKTCIYCGYPKHINRTKCPAKDSLCNACGKKGHFSKVCRSRPVSKSHSAAMYLSSINTTTGLDSLSKATVQVSLNGKQFTALIDSGSSQSFIRSDIPEKENWEVTPSNGVVTLASTTRTTKIQGYVETLMSYKNQKYKQVKLSLLPNACAEVILGHDFLERHKSVEISFKGELPTFSCGLSAVNIEIPPLFANLHHDCTPIATRSRRFSPPDREFIDQEVRRLLDEDIIEPSNSPWRAQVLVTSNANHKRRMVVDYSQTINKFTYLDAYPQKRIDSMIEEISKFQFFSTLDFKSAYHQLPLRPEEKPFTAFEAAGNLYHFKRVPFGVTNGVSCFQRVVDSVITNENLNATFAYVDNVTICGDTKEEHDINLKRFQDAVQKYGFTFNHSKSVFAATTINLLGYQVSKGVIRPDPERFEALRQMEPPKSAKSQQRVVGMFAYYSPWISHFSDKILPLSQNKQFPLPPCVVETFEQLKKELENAALVTVDPKVQLIVETDASDEAISATLNQEGRPVAFFSRTLNRSEKNHTSVEKEAYAVIESLRKWQHYLINSHFKLITDQKSVSFIYDKKFKGKVKNDKIQRWKIELSQFQFDIVYRPGPENLAADALSRAVCGASMTEENNLRKLHETLCHPGVTRMLHFVKTKNLPYSLEDIKNVTSKCHACAELKPQFFKPPKQTLVKATQPFERLSIDFKGPVPSRSNNKYILTVIDEFSRFPFAFAVPNMFSSTVISCLVQLFSIFGTPAYVHSDRGRSFMSEELKNFLHSKGVVTSRTTPYNPTGNS